MERKCSFCGVTTAEVEFYAGVTNRCKECHKRKVRENRIANLDYYRASDAKRFREDPRVRERHRRYQATEAGKAAVRRARDKWLATNADKRAAHVILGNAVRDGKIHKPTRCAACGGGGRIDGHHEDYTRPLVVKWLCRRCHVAEHSD